MENEDWSHTIRSRSSFSIDSLKDVWHYRDLLWMFVKRDIVTNYKQTSFGSAMVCYSAGAYYLNVCNHF
jgi:lipopolysaccharide transport system permease protein